MAQLTVITEEVAHVDGTVDADRPSMLIDPSLLPATMGWELKPSGLCQADNCVPVADPAALRVGESVDVLAVARALGRQAAVDLDAGIVAVSLSGELRRRALRDLEAPEFTLPDLSDQPHSLSDWAGLKRLLVTFSSWCGCRYDLPGWQELNDELAEEGFVVIAVAIDDSPKAVLRFTDGITMPVLYDPQHVLTELYAISNVPTVVWIDETGRIVRPNAEAFGTDTFKDFTGHASSPHLQLVRDWVRKGVVPIEEEEAKGVVADLSDDEVLARLHFRIAAELRRRGDEDGTRRHIDTASALAPDDLTVWRAGMPLVGENPFGELFFERYDAWKERGSPSHGLPSIDEA